MTIKLPSKKGERVTIWSGFEPDAEGPSRIVMTSDGRGRWSMSTESAHPEDPDYGGGEEWEDGENYFWEDPGSVAPESLTRAMIALAAAVRDDARFCIRPMATPADPSFTGNGENIIAKMKGNRCLVVENFGSSSDGDLLVSIRTSKPLDPGQWVSALGNLAKAIDSYNQEFG